MPKKPEDYLKSLQTRLNFYKSLIDNSADWEYMIDNNNNCLYVSPSVERITGYKPEEFYTEASLLHTIIHPDDQKYFYKHKHSLNEKGERGSIEFRIITKDNKIEWISHDCLDVQDESGQIIGIRGSNRLITDKKIIEEKYLQLSKINRSVIDQAPIGIGAYAANGRCLSANPILAKIIGTSPEKVLDQNYHQLEPWKKSGLYNIVQEALRRKEITEYEIEVDSTFGKHVYLNCTIVPFDFDSKIQFLLLIEDISKRKIAEKQVLLGKQTYKDLVQNAQSIILKVDKNATITFINEFAQQFFGFSAKEILGKKLIGTIVPEFDSDGNDLRKMISDVFNVESTADFLDNENENICKNGDRVWVAWRNKAFYNNKKEITEILCIGIDNTQKHRAELELRKGQEITKAILNATDESAFLIDRNGVFLEMNTTTAKRFNSTRKELIGKCVYNLVPSDILDNRKKLINQVFKTHKQITHIDERNGMILENRIYPVTNSKNEVYQAAIFSKDITKERTAKRKLIESEEKFRTIAKTISDGITIADEQGNYIYVNEGFCRMTGYSEEELLNLRVHDMQAKKDSSPDVFQKVLDNGSYTENKVQLKRKDNTSYYARVSAQKMEYGGQNLLLGLISDQTAQIEQEKELEKLLAAKDKFISIISHDLRLPFNAMLGFSEVLLERIQNKEFDDLERIAQILKDTSENTFELLENLLMWGRSQRDAIEFDPQKYKLNDLIKQVYKHVIPSAVTKRIEIKLATIHEAFIFADKSMLETVIRNLLSNAVKFTATRGEIVISTKKEGNTIQITITDNGIGMDPKRINQLFKIEYAESAPGTNGEKGTGLGLLLCKEFVEKNKGKIYVSSKHGVGSTFTVELPLYE